MKTTRFVAAGASLLVLVFACTSHAQAQTTTTLTVPSWAGNLLFEHSQITADPTLTAPEAQGLGLKFELLGGMTNAQDPQNTDNDVITVTTTAGTFASPGVIGVAVRDMLPNAKVATLTNMINLKYFFVSRSCDGGSPRIQLLIDPGDGTGPRNANGYVGTAPGDLGGCPANVWVFQDMANLADTLPNWDLSQWADHGSAAFCTAGNPFFCTWTQVVAFFATLPNHVVLSGGLYDDSCSVSLSFTPSFAPLSCGTAYYDLLTVENRTLENRQDTVQGPTH
jgi:hypothetical protein